MSCIDDAFDISNIDDALNVSSRGDVLYICNYDKDRQTLTKYKQLY